MGKRDESSSSRVAILVAIISAAATIIAAGISQLPKVLSSRAEREPSRTEASLPDPATKSSGAPPAPTPSKTISVAGRWLNDREPASTHEFLPGGRYRYGSKGKTNEGAWSQEGYSVSFEWIDRTTKELNKRCLKIVSAEGDTMTVLLESQRAYTWKKMDR
jgi:hypothetical protein